MLKLSWETDAAMRHASSNDYARRMARWLRSRPELAPHSGRMVREWCHAQVERARSHGIASEDAVARFARLALLRDDGWFASDEVREILESTRTGDLKVFQLECLDEGVRDG